MKNRHGDIDNNRKADMLKNNLPIKIIADDRKCKCEVIGHYCKLKVLMPPFVDFPWLIIRLITFQLLKERH